MTTYQRESIADVRADIEPLLVQHWEEIARFKDVPLDPDWPAYGLAEERGCLRVFTARRAGALLGYGVFFKGNLHYRSSVLFTQDIFFVLPQNRAIVGARLLRYCDEQLQAEGAQAVYHHVKTHLDWGPVLARMGYEKVDTIYGRRF
jgi:hypothetical protein